MNVVLASRDGTLCIYEMYCRCRDADDIDDEYVIRKGDGVNDISNERDDSKVIGSHLSLWDSS